MSQVFHKDYSGEAPKEYFQAPYLPYHLRLLLAALVVNCGYIRRLLCFQFLEIGTSLKREVLVVCTTLVLMLFEICSRKEPS